MITQICSLQSWYYEQAPGILWRRKKEDSQLDPGLSLSCPGLGQHALNAVNSLLAHIKMQHSYGSAEYADLGIPLR
jgi:hypothetical protein